MSRATPDQRPVVSAELRRSADGPLADHKWPPRSADSKHGIAAGMSPGRKPERWWRIAGGLCLMAAGIDELVAVVANADTGGTPNQLLANLAANPGGARTEALLGVLLPVLLVPGLLPLIDLAPVRGRHTVYVGVCLSLIGGIGHALLSMTTLVALPLADVSQDRSVTGPLLDKIGANLIPVALPLTAIAVVGLFVVIAGLWRAHWAPVWMLAAYGIWMILAILPLASRLGSLTFIKEIPFLAVFVWLGADLIRRSSLSVESGTSA